MKKVGDKVWCWDPACKPVEGVITHVRPGTIPAYKCKLYDSSVAPERWWAPYRLYLCPGEIDSLWDDMVDHAKYLRSCAKELYESYAATYEEKIKEAVVEGCATRLTTQQRNMPKAFQEIVNDNFMDLF